MSISRHVVYRNSHAEGHTGPPKVVLRDSPARPSLKSLAYVIAVPEGRKVQGQIEGDSQVGDGVWRVER